MSTDSSFKPRPEQLAEMLYPVEVETFLRDYADQRSLLIKGHPDKFADLGFDEEAFLAAAEKLTPNAQLLKTAVPSSGEEERFAEIAPADVRRLYREQQLTLCAGGISDVHPGLGAFAEGVRLALSIPDLRFNSYLSPNGSGFNLHYDVQPVFLLQIGGRKHWWYGAEPVQPMPRVYSASWGQKPALDTLQTTVLEPGDVLYLPAFTWHRARADGYSLGVTLGVKGPHNRPLRSAVARSALFGEWPMTGQMQPPIDPALAGQQEVPPAARAYLEAQLAALRAQVQELTVEQLWQVWLDEVHTPRQPMLPRDDTDVHSELSIHRARSFPVHLSQVADDQGRPLLIVRHAGHRVVLEPATEPLVRWLLSLEQPVTVAAAIRHGSELGLTRQPVKKAVRELVAMGVLSAEC